MEAKGLWITLWIHCLRKSVYGDYLKAKAKQSKVHCEELERVYPLMEQFYNDFGEMKYRDNEFFPKRLGLFHVFKRTELVSDAASYIYTPGRLLLSIPALESKVDALASVQHFLNDFYGKPYTYKNEDGIEVSIDLRFDSVRQMAAAESKFESVRVMAMPFPSTKERPKYELHGNVNATSLSKLKKAIYIGKMDDSLSLVDTILYIKQDNKNPFGWGITLSDKVALQAGNFANGYTAGSEPVIVSQFRTHFKNLLSNVVQGRFPDYS